MRTRHSALHRIFSFLEDYQWVIIVAAGITAFALGCIGYWEYLKGPSASDVVYASMQLFFGTTMAEHHMPKSLDIARFLAFFVTGWAGLTAVMALFADRLRQMRIPWMRGHIVVCGLGYVGSVFVRQLWECGARVVVIDADVTHPNIDLCRSRGIPVIIGDAQLKRTLKAAGLQRAARLLAITDKDAVNTEIVAVASQLAKERSHAEFSCLARIADPDLCVLLRAQEVQCSEGASALDFFNADEIGARLLLDDFPVDTRGEQLHILIAHLDPLGAWLVVHVAREWFDNRSGEDTQLLVTVLDDNAERRVAALVGQHPALEKVCQFITLSTSARDIHRLSAYHAQAGVPPLNCAYVTAYRDEDALQTALKLRHAVGSAVPLVVALSRAQGVSRVINDVRDTSHVLAKVDVFPTLERTCTADLVWGGSFETIAHAMHERWRTEQLTMGKPAPSWAELDESRKRSNRAHARDITVKLRSIGCELAPLRDWDAADFTFTDDEIEMLAMAEHDRWWQERLADGWTLGDKDAELKKTPYLVPFEELSDEVAGWDRMFVRKYAALLASAGLQVIRVV